MEAKAIPDHELVQICMKELCKKAGFEDSRNLVQRDLEFVCDSIETKTAVLISLSTIKRLLNGQFTRQPQVATLNAIAQYAGYTNWQDFKLNKNLANNGPAMQEANGNTAVIPASNTSRRSYLRYMVIAGLLVFAAIGLFAVLQARKLLSGSPGKASFAMHKITNNDLPNSVVFNYNVDDVNADSFFIQQSWDKNRRVRIEKKSYALTDIYYEPGYHIAKLIANDQVIKTLDVSIPTDHWFFYAKEKIARPMPKYISSTGIKNGSLLLDKEELLASQVDIQKENQYLQVYFPSAITESSDSFILHCRLRVHPLRNEPCPYFMCEVFCQRNFKFFISSPKGCASNLKAQFGENYLDGKTHDLSALGTPVEEWQDVQVTVKNKQASIRINNKEVFTAAYQQPSGLITGLGFISNGLCEVDFVRLQTLDGKDIYNNDFGK